MIKMNSNVIFSYGSRFLRTSESGCVRFDLKTNFFGIISKCLTLCRNLLVCEIIILGMPTAGDHCIIMEYNCNWVWLCIVAVASSLFGDDDILFLVFLFLKNIFLTGGCASFLNLSERLENEIRAIRPFQSTFNIYTASDPILDAWHGARKWSLLPDLAQRSIPLSDYEEKGGDYLREHCSSNRYIPTPSSQ